MELLVNFFADDALLIVIFIAACALIRPVFRHKQSIAVLVMAGLTSLLVGKIMSLLYQPTTSRPFLELGVTPGASYIDNPGFPSDHALLATVVVVAVHMIVRSRKLTLFLVVVVGLMCVARVMALVHTPIDIIGGIAAGLLGTYWYRKLTK